MPDITEALVNERLKVLLLLSTSMLSSFADAGRVAVVNLFMNETAPRGVCSLTAIRHELRIDRPNVRAINMLHLKPYRFVGRNGSEDVRRKHHFAISILSKMPRLGPEIVVL